MYFHGLFAVDGQSPSLWDFEGMSSSIWDFRNCQLLGFVGRVCILPCIFVLAEITVLRCRPIPRYTAAVSHRHIRVPPMAPIRFAVPAQKMAIRVMPQNRANHLWFLGKFEAIRESKSNQKTKQKIRIESHQQRLSNGLVTGEVFGNEHQSPLPGYV